MLSQRDIRQAFDKPIFKVGDSYLNSEWTEGFIVTGIDKELASVDYFENGEKKVSDKVYVSQVNAVARGSRLPNRIYAMDKITSCDNCRELQHTKHAIYDENAAVAFTKCGNCDYKIPISKQDLKDRM